MYTKKGDEISWYPNGTSNHGVVCDVWWCVPQIPWHRHDCVCEEFSCSQIVSWISFFIHASQARHKNARHRRSHKATSTQNHATNTHNAHPWHPATLTFDQTSNQHPKGILSFEGVLNLSDPSRIYFILAHFRPSLYRLEWSISNDYLSSAQHPSCRMQQALQSQEQQGPLCCQTTLTYWQRNQVQANLWIWYL